MIAPLSSKLLSYYNPHRHGSEMLKKLLKPDLLNNVPANAKLAFAVPPPLFRGEARVLVWGEGALVNKNWTEKMKICTIKTKTQTESERE